MSKEYMNYLNESFPSMAEKLAAGFEDNIAQGKQNKKTLKIDNVANLMRETFLNESKSICKEAGEVSFSFLEKDGFIENRIVKLAGLLIQDSTPESIEQVLKNYVYNELSFFPDKLEIKVNIIPMSETEVKTKGYTDLEIKDATGTVDIMYNGALVQLPFLMRDKEILPFDTIQMGSESAVYTRTNIRNILLNLKSLANKSQSVTGTALNQTDPLSSFVGVEKRIGPLTDSGFMENMLRIQNTLEQAGYKANTNIAYASIIEDLLEKTASMKKCNYNFDFIEKQLEYKTRHIIDKPVLELEKKAFSDDLKPESFGDIQILRNKSQFQFAELEEDLLAHNLASVFNGLINANNIKLSDRIVVTSDGRFKILKPGERFAFLLPGEEGMPSFNHKYRNIESLNPGRLYLGLLNGLCLMPFTVSALNSGGTRGWSITKIYTCFDIDGLEFNVIPDPGLSKNQILIMNKNKALGRLMQKDDPTKVQEYNLILHRRRPVVFISSDVEFIELSQTPIQNLSSSKEMAYLLDSNMKIAYMTDSVVIVKLEGVGAPKYNLGVNWFDNRSRSMRETVITGIDEIKVKGDLKTIGYNYDKIREMMDRANSEGHATYALTPEITPWLLKERTNLMSALNNLTNDVRSKLFSVENTTKILGAASGNAVTSALGNCDYLSGTVSGMGVFAEESEALANKLEKVAMAKESPTFNKLAGLMVIKNRIDRMINGTLNNELWEGAECLAELKTLVPELEKLAYDLVELKLSQTIHKNEILSPNVIDGTLKQLDELYKYAVQL